MPRKLILIRHCEAEISSRDGTDHGRRLSSNGRNVAREIGTWLDESGQIPDIVLCSSALRAVDTWANISSQLSSLPTLQFRNEIYDATIRELQYVIESTVGNTICVIGHNPSLAVVAQTLSQGIESTSDLNVFKCGTVAVFQAAKPEWAPFAPNFFDSADVFEPTI